MSCKHAEDVCQDCLEKVDTTTEYPYPKFCQHCHGGKKDSPPLLKAEKINRILFDSAVIAATGYAAARTTELLFGIFNFGGRALIDLLKTIGAPKRIILF